MMYWDPDLHEMVCDEEETPFKLNPPKEVPSCPQVDPLSLYAALKIASVPKSEYTSWNVKPVVTTPAKILAFSLFLVEALYGCAILLWIFCSFILPMTDHLPSFLGLVVAPIALGTWVYYTEEKEIAKGEDESLCGL